VRALVISEDALIVLFTVPIALAKSPPNDSPSSLETPEGERGLETEPTPGSEGRAEGFEPPAAPRLEIP